jgi:hypothetical protein
MARLKWFKLHVSVRRLPDSVETMTRPNADLLRSPELNYEQWRDALRADWRLYTPDDLKAFAGRATSRSICGLKASDISNNVRGCERTQRDIHRDDIDHWFAVFQIAG